MNNWVSTSKLSKKLGLTKQTFEALTVSSTDEIHILTSDFLATFPTGLLYLSDNSKDIVAYVARYISHSLIQRSKCVFCFELLQKDPMNTYYIEILLQLPTVVLYKYVETAFCILESFKSQILGTKFPTKHVMLTYLHSYQLNGILVLFAIYMLLIVVR